MREHDFNVAGGGAGGCVVAARLVQAGMRVLLIEAGP
ncbi:MAG: NAD(P)-binding protein, partial [Advenella sp.]